MTGACRNKSEIMLNMCRYVLSKRFYSIFMLFKSDSIARKICSNYKNCWLRFRVPKFLFNHGLSYFLPLRIVAPMCLLTSLHSEWFFSQTHLHFMIHRFSNRIKLWFRTKCSSFNDVWKVFVILGINLVKQNSFLYYIH